MRVGINIKIDVTKIDKNRIFNGEKGKYIDLTTFVNLDEQDQYGQNGFISQSVSKEEKEQGVQTPILGNCKVFYKEQAQQDKPDQGYMKAQPIPDDDIPF